MIGGSGGDGCLSFLSVFRIEFAGPDGGNGGNGGHVVFQGKGHRCLIRAWVRVFRIIYEFRILRLSIELGSF